MTFRFAKFILLIFVFAATALLVSAADESPKITFAELPAAVQKTVQTNLNGGIVGEIQRAKEDEEVTYDIEIIKGETGRSFSIAEDGTLLSMGVELAETPAAVRQTIQKQAGRDAVESIEKQFDDGEVNYGVELTTKDGAGRSFTVAENGKIERLQLKLTEVPVVVRGAIEGWVGKGKLGDIFRVSDEDEIYYDVEMSRDGKDREFTVTDKGEMESAEVFLSELSKPAQRSIKEKIGNGQILRIDQMLEKKQGTVPYEVEGRKDGKPFNFRVGPKGRFLGMDE